MGIFKKSRPIDRWVQDLQNLSETDPDQFRDVRQRDESTCIVTLRDGEEVWITNNGTDVYFIVGLDSIRDMAGKCGMSLPDAYGEMTGRMTTCSLGIDGDGSLRFATVLTGKDYSAERMQDLMYRLTFQVMDYNQALDLFIRDHRELMA